VLRRVFVRRVVAAADVAALKTEPQVDPLVSRSKTFLASVRRVRPVIPRLTEVNAELLTHISSVRSGRSFGSRWLDLGHGVLVAADRREEEV
jgi:hypothetical protein